jgi:hypothetical protein
MDGGERDFVDEDGANGVEEDLKGTEERFAKHGVKKDCFKSSGQVGVESINA